VITTNVVLVADPPITHIALAAVGINGTGEKERFVGCPVLAGDCSVGNMLVVPVAQLVPVPYLTKHVEAVEVVLAHVTLEI